MKKKTTKVAMAKAMEGKHELHDDIGYVRSLFCGKCLKKLPEDRRGMSNDQARDRWGHSGRRHFCDDCWPKKVVEFQLLAKEMLEKAGRL